MSQLDSVEVTCPAGTVQGTAHGHMRRFESIPYSRISAPFNDAVAAEDGALIDATRPRPESIALSVTTPANAQAGSDCPVLVFIHGGRFETGTHADPRTAAEDFAAAGIVQVRIGYRLKLAGLARFSDDAASHYRAAHDCQLALEWIQRNIEFFGGDPTNVTLVGQSAGASLVLWLARRDHFRGGFRRAIAISPAFPRMTFAQRKAILRGALGKPVTRAVLNNAAESRVERAYRRLRQFYFTDIALGPAPFEAAELAEVPLIISSTREEMYDSARRLDSLGLGAVPFFLLGPRMGLPFSRLSSYFAAVREFAPRQVWGQLISDSLIRRWVDQVAEGAPGPVWQVEFASPQAPITHCDDLEEMFSAGSHIYSWVVGFCRGNDPDWPEYGPQRQVLRTALDGSGRDIVRDPLGYVRSAFPPPRYSSLRRRGSANSSTSHGE
ncbi:carboxylesterase family protein [Corynebacterium mayonis]|uniref:carboxylesterase family protein n=1 Tax=Corynebacterium mayonis TaxID=3062461 RepID=UPI00313FF7CF